MPTNRRINRRRETDGSVPVRPHASTGPRYLSRFEHPDDALPIERAVAEIVCRLILCMKSMERGNDFIRLGAAAAGGLLVWSDHVLNQLVDGLRKKGGRRTRLDANEASKVEFSLNRRDLSLTLLDGDLISEKDITLGELVDPDELLYLSNEWFNPLIHDYPLRSRLALDTIEWLAKGVPREQGLPHQVNAAYLSEGLGLDAAGRGLLELIGLVIAAPALLGTFGSIAFGDFRRGVRMVASMIGCSEQDVEAHYQPNSMLRRCGVLSREHDPGLRHSIGTLDDLLNCHNPQVRSTLTQSFDTAQAFFASFLSPSSSSLVKLTDVQHLGRFTEMALPSLRNACKQGAPGLNIMLYGPPGTGKTEYAKLLAEEAGLQLFEVACDDGFGGGMGTPDRLGNLLLALLSLKGRRDAMVLLDEAEDIFPDSGGSALHRIFGLPHTSGKKDQSKAWMNRLLETMTVPVIWTTNSIRAIDPATLRRFSLVLKMDEPPRSVKRRLAQQYLGGLNLPAAQLDAIASLTQLTPGHLEITARTVILAAPESPEQASTFVDQQLTNARRALGLPTLVRRRDTAITYDTRFVNIRGGHSVETLLPALSRHSRAALCFYGVPGTGKTEFGHHIAKHLDRELIVKSGSDLLSPWVGQTEQLIAQMFENAADRSDEVVLLLDEADTLLSDRAHAGASWEVSQTNEFLAQMESFPGLFICTTNMLDRVDAAVLRRFQFRLEFEALREDQLLILFGQTFGRSTTPCEEPALRRLAGMAVTADFANIARVLRFAPELIDGDLVALVQEEVRGRRGLTGNARPMGFTH
jgi:SpoVK/Ycf46/Vps4 family AAA+-type ATPase